MACLDDVLPGTAQLAPLLNANFAWGCAGVTLALEPGSGGLVLKRRSGAQDLADGLLPVLESLVAAAEGWANRLAPPPAAPEAAPAALPVGEMLRA
jgi:hypothetical protein